MKTVTLVKNNFDQAVDAALEVLCNKKLVIAPSDTVYGLLADATSEEAVNKMISFKNRPPGKPISVFVADIAMMEDYIYVDDRQRQLIEKLLPGPFTIIFKSKRKVSRLLESEKGTLGVRLPDYPFINEIVSQFGRPITATSANLSGRSPHYRIDTLLKELPESKKQLIDLVIDAGKLPRNKPSTIVDLTTPELKILRKGDIVFQNTEIFVSDSPEQTRKIARFIFQKEMHVLRHKPLTIIIEGELGVGKTIFTKGVGELLGIENIVSPSYTVSYEYDINKDNIKKLAHYDLYNVEEKEELAHLGIEEYIRPGNILIFEWGEKAGDIYRLLKEKSRVIYIKMEYVDEKKRKLIIKS